MKLIKCEINNIKFLVYFFSLISFFLTSCALFRTIPTPTLNETRKQSMKPAVEDLLRLVPDWKNWDEVQAWIQQGVNLSKHFSRDQITSDSFISLSWADLLEEGKVPLGLYASEKWRKFVLMIFLADLISYPNTVDQVNFDRLQFVMHSFPVGFRAWWIQLPNQSWWPAGYTGWYPMYENVFSSFETSPAQIKNRMVVPNLYVKNSDAFLYLFNYSVAPGLKKSQLSNALIKTFSHEIHSKKPRGLACISVSEDGDRIASKFNMSSSGAFSIGENIEKVFTKRFN